MSTKHQLLFLTNIVNPYQLDLFEDLASYYDLSVIYFAKIEKDRSWNLSEKSNRYKSLILNSSFLNKCMQKISHDLYFQLSLIPYLLHFSGSRVIISGNYYSPNTWLAIFIMKFRHIKVYWMGDQIKPKASPMKKVFKRFFLWPIFYLFDGLLAVGDVAMKSYRDYGYSGPIVSIMHSISAERFQGNFKKSNEVLRVVMPGSLIYRKGVDIGLKAFENALKVVKKRCELRVIGDGPLMPTFMQAYQEHPHINFLGFKSPNELDYELMSADIFLFCTRYDSWGVVVNEAISAGLPVIVSNQCGSSELVFAGGGFVCKSEDVGEFTKALVILIDNPALRQLMSEHHLKLRDRYTSNVMAKKIYEFIN
jgi:glycosyltransferase involved in cell wall biosynthesis